MCPGWKSLTALELSCQPGIQDRSGCNDIVAIGKEKRAGWDQVLARCARSLSPG